MTKGNAEELQAVLAAIERQIETLYRLNHDDTAKILAVAKLDLQTRIHGITPEELLALTNAIEQTCPLDDPPVVIRLTKRNGH